jgi:hypothetical protein
MYAYRLPDSKKLSFQSSTFEGARLAALAAASARHKGGVSEAAAARSLECLTENQKARLWAQLETVGWRIERIT